MSDLSFKNVHPDARIGENVTISQFTTIEGDVEIGEGTWIGPNVSIMNGVTIGKNCRIFPGAILGSVPQDLKFEGEQSELVIGDNVTIREYCTLNRGTKANMKTEISNNCLLMAYVHVAHDCILHENVILANNVNLAGHIEVGKNCVLGGLTAVHQFVKIGDHCMIGGGSLVRKDVPPYVKAAREPLSFVGVNSIGLRRRGFSNEEINHIQDIYRILFSQAIGLIEATISASPFREKILGFIKDGDRGIMRGFRQIASNGSRS
jgi:UDP-N-acetylglucosamine acyltransferase